MVIGLCFGAAYQATDLAIVLQKENQNKLCQQEGQQGRAICMGQKIQELYIDRLALMGYF
jgi:ApbE superfamily uncharacterized protein (UPF0280 family)